jgi:hypothetical protein
MASHNPFTVQRIAQCLDILDQLHASGLAARAFAATHQHSYVQVRAWLTHEARWRTRLSVAPESVKAQTIPTRFAPVQIQSHAAAQPLVINTPAVQAIRVDCASGDGKRTASVHFPLCDAQLSAQWTAAYLSAYR